MGDASLRVQTKYPSAGALLHVVGPTLQRGSLRVPIHVAFEQPFELILASLDGEEAVCGTAEVIEHAGDATWVRFMSASRESTSESARCVLVDTEVMSPASLTAKADAFDAITAVNDVPAQLAEVPTGAAEPVQVASLPLPPPPPPLDPLFDVTDASRVGPLPLPPASSSTIAEAAAAACELGAEVREGETREGETTMVESRRDVDVAALAALEGRFDALSDVDGDDLRVPHTGESPPLVMMPVIPSPTAKLQVSREAQAAVVAASVHATELSMPALESPASEGDADGAYATELTMPALESPKTEPTASGLASSTSDAESAEATATDDNSTAVIVDSNPPDDQRPTVESPPIVASLLQMTSGDDAIAAQRGIRAITNPSTRVAKPTNRRIVIAAASVAAVSLVIAAGSVMWARDAVAHAERAQPTPPVASAPVAAPAPAPVAQVVEQPPAVVEQPVAPAPASCTLDVFSSVADSSVYVNGAANGSTPASASVACGEPVTVEIRHARYETFKRTVTPTGRTELRATLEREKTALHVTSEPAGASVTYNGAPIGKTPLTVKIPRYEQGTLNFSMAGMQADWRRIVPKTREKTVTIALRKR